jgi:GR25 family glycosyltransferase involved in LPS biosynthesis
MEENKKLAPICLFVFSRINELKVTIDTLQKNYLASESQLFIFLDGSGAEHDNVSVNQVRKFIYTINGFSKVTIYESDNHKGLAKSVISGVTKILDNYENVIVLEDDLILSTNFLCFMNQALTFYEEKQRILSISGYSFKLKYPNNYNFDVALSLRSSSWGWATWKNRWDKIDWELNDYSSFRWNFLNQIRFNRGGSDLSRLLYRKVKCAIDSWAIRFVYHQFKNNYLDVFPVTSKVLNNGFNSEATHTKYKSKRFDTELDVSGQCNFSFMSTLQIDKSVKKQFYKHYSFRGRLKDKILQILWK